MSQLSTFLSGLEQQLAEGLLAGSLSNSVSTGLSTFLSGTPAATLADAQAYVNGQVATLLADAISRLPGWEQPIAQVFAAAGSPSIQKWVDGIVSEVYTKLVKQIAGTTAGSAIVAGTPPAAIAA